MKKCKFLPGHKYWYGDLSKFGFYGEILCTKRINYKKHKKTILKFMITNLIIKNFNAGARSFLAWFYDENPIHLYSGDFENIEEIDTWYFTLSAENEIVSE